MRKKSEYSQLLRSPKWQKMRLEVMERDEFTCQKCFSSECTLNVHHTYYEKGASPWEYPLGSLITLCEECHSIETHDGYLMKQELLKSFCRKGLLAADFLELARGFDDAAFRGVPSVFASAISWAVSNPTILDNLVELYFESLKEKKEAA